MREKHEFLREVQKLQLERDKEMARLKKLEQIAQKRIEDHEALVQLKKEIKEREVVLRQMRAERLGIPILGAYPVQQSQTPEIDLEGADASSASSGHQSDGKRQVALPSDPSIERIELASSHIIDDENSARVGE